MKKLTSFSSALALIATVGALSLSTEAAKVSRHCEAQINGFQVERCDMSYLANTKQNPDFVNGYFIDLPLNATKDSWGKKKIKNSVLHYRGRALNTGTSISYACPLTNPKENRTVKSCEISIQYQNSAKPGSSVHSAVNSIPRGTTFTSPHYAVVKRMKWQENY